jgi:hypothetical protein
LADGVVSGGGIRVVQQGVGGRIQRRVLDQRLGNLGRVKPHLD